MAQPPDYGSYVKRETKEFKILKFIKVALLVTLILGAIEVVIIYFIMNNGKEKPQTALIKKPVIPVKIITPDIDTSQQKSTDSILIKEVAAPIIIDTPKPAIIVKKDSVVLKPIVVKPIVVKPIVVVKDTIKAIRDTSKVKPVEKELTQLKMQSILENVRTQKIKFNITSNCIQIRKTNSSNVKNAFKIAEYLKKNGFIIGGRLTVDGNVQGVKVKMDANCIELTIGTL